MKASGNNPALNHGGEEKSPQMRETQEAAVSVPVLSGEDLALFESPFRAFSILRDNGSIVKANARFCEQFALEDNFRHLNLLDRLQPVDQRLLSRKFLLARHHGNSCNASIHCLSGGREPVNFLIRPGKDFLFLEEVVNRPNETHLSEEAESVLLQPKTLPKKVSETTEDNDWWFDVLPFPSLLYNEHLELWKANQKFLDLTDYSQQDFAIPGMEEVLFPEDVRKISALKEELLAEGKQEAGSEVMLRLRNGRIHWMRLTLCPLPPNPSTGKPGYLAVLQNIDALKKKEEAIELRQEEMELFIDHLSHDLKGPLNSLLSLYALVEHDFKEDEKVMEYAGYYHGGISRLHRMVSDTLKLSKIRQSVPGTDYTNLPHLIEDCLQTFRNLPESARINFVKKVEVPEKLGLEEKLLRTILQNLLENAIKYSSEVNPRVEIFAREEGEGVTIEIADNGIGIPEEAQERVFERFFRATELAGGTGLGLYIVKQAVSKLNGHIYLRSQAGKGSTFIVKLPYSSPV